MTHALCISKSTDSLVIKLTWNVKLFFTMVNNARQNIKFGEKPFENNVAIERKTQVTKHNKICSDKF